MGEYANSKQDIVDVMDEIKKGLGDVSLPFLFVGKILQRGPLDNNTFTCSSLGRFPLSTMK